MGTLVINVPEKKTALVKRLLKELGVTIDKKATLNRNRSHIPNALTAKTIKDAHKGIDVEGPITDLRAFMDSL
ncbi:MAG: hypothetical protein ACTHMI_22035 [Mucilaginibacter sp.]